ncbi:RteC protein [Mariniflexile rhizosphaerae]|uniref:RteC domain-containing protein n=1 Tax=unclassified Mariniflexile TaxID=2643887 RepID=UPI000E33401A|nr:RteC domain-containing protein [Mariniflexile sp. TRM1-10]AXP79784.1 RteC protein [Mariniflexile sp. TRM1-10]
MTHSIYKNTLLSISKHEEALSLKAASIIEECYQMTIFLRELLSDLKKKVQASGFNTPNDEIDFFRKIKPQVLGKLIYYNKVYRIESGCPVNNGKMYHDYFSNELQLLKQEYKDYIRNSDFYRYYKTGRTDRDHEFFRLGKLNLPIGLNSFVFEIDSQFSTYYDYKVSHIIANELLYTYLLSRITPDEIQGPFSPETPATAKDVFWTDSKNALIELIYALYVSGAISHGKIGIRKISLVFQILFRTPLGDIHHAFHRMKDRAGSKTAFLDELKSSLEEYMNKGL